MSTPSHSTASAPAGTQTPWRERLAVLLLVVNAIPYPAFTFYAEHVDDRYSEQPASLLVEVGLFVPLVAVPMGVLLAIVGTVWTVPEKLAAAALSLGWIAPYFIATADFGCDETGGTASPCSVSPTSDGRELGLVLVVLAMAATATWLLRRATTRSQLR